MPLVRSGTPPCGQIWGASAAGQGSRLAPTGQPCGCPDALLGAGEAVALAPPRCLAGSMLHCSGRAPATFRRTVLPLMPCSAPAASCVRRDPPSSATGAAYAAFGAFYVLKVNLAAHIHRRRSHSWQLTQGEPPRPPSAEKRQQWQGQSAAKRKHTRTRREKLEDCSPAGPRSN